MGIFPMKSWFENQQEKQKMNKVQRMLGLKTVPNNTYMNDEQALHFTCAPDRKMVGPLGGLEYPVALKVRQQNQRLRVLWYLLSCQKDPDWYKGADDIYADKRELYYYFLGQATVTKMTVKKCRPFLP